MRYHTKFAVDLSILRDNFSLLQELAPSNDVIFMIKCDAYGHGIAPIAQYAYQELGVRTFGLATLGEAVALRKELPSMKARMIVFSDTALDSKECRELYLDYNIHPVISSMEDLRLFLGERGFSKLPLLIKVNTGMNRLGIAMEEVSEAARAIVAGGRKSVNHLMTHFSSSFLKLREGDRSHSQFAQFKEFRAQLQSAGLSVEETSCSNSGAIEQGFALEESHIRPGLMLYGPSSVFSNEGESGSWKGRNISRLETRIVKSFLVKKGTPIGYGGHVCHRDGRLVYLPIGYGDGFLSYYSKAEFNIEGRTARALGRVNMDLCALLFESDLSEDMKA